MAVPTRPSTRHLGTAVESVLAQSLEDWRLHVSANGREGGEAAQLLDRLDDPRVSWTVTGDELGAAGNHNRALDAGTAPYVALLHDDDRWAPEFLEHHVRFLEECRSCGFVFSGVTLLDEKGAVLGTKPPPVEEGVHPPREAVAWLYRSNPVSVAAVVVRRDAFDAVGGRVREDLLFFDYELWLRLAARFPFGVLDRCDGQYRLHQTAVSWGSRLEFGRHRLEVLAAADEYVDVPPRVRSRAYAAARATAALDAVEGGNRQLARHHLGRLLGHERVGLLDAGTAARTAAAASALLLGRVGQLVIRRYRAAGALGGRPERGGSVLRAWARLRS